MNIINKEQHDELIKILSELIETIVIMRKEELEILKKKYQKSEQALQYPYFCGDNWSAIEDLMYDKLPVRELWRV